MKRNHRITLLLHALSCMAPTDGEASTNGGAPSTGSAADDVIADKAAIETAKTEIADDEAKLEADKAALTDLETKLEADEAAAEVEAHPVLAVFTKMESLVSACAADVVSEFHSLLAEARGLVDGNLSAPSEAPATENPAAGVSEAA